MNMTHLEYSKLILEKVSFDYHLFEKELQKSVRQLIDLEVTELKAWCFLTFDATYWLIIERCC